MSDDVKRNDPDNKYDTSGIVKREAVMYAGDLKLAVYRVRDPETGEYGKRNFHMTYNNCVMALMGEEAAKLFATWVTSSLKADEQA